MKIAFLDKIKKDTKFRIKTFLNFSFTANIIYSSLLFVISLVYSSKWFFVMAIYYLLLSFIRVVIFMQLKKDNHLQSRVKTMRNLGCFLLVLNIVITVMMLILVFEKTETNYHEITVIALATYTFASLTMAIIGSVKHIKQNNHLFSCAKLIMLTSASVSLTTLTNTMLMTFGKNNAKLRSIILPLLCIAVCVFITTSAILIIRKANLELRKLKYEKK